MDLTWDSLDIHQELKEIIKHGFKFEKMTAVQAASIPLFITNKDLTVEAVTGSGKTMAFVVPILQILLRKCQSEELKPHDIGAVVISPTRELATQIYDVFQVFIDKLKAAQFRLMLLIGGSNPHKDIKTYMSHGANIVVSTPGRLYDLLEKSDNFSGKVRKCLEVCVLDEADQLLSMGFEKTLNDILSYLPKLRRTSLFSATQTKELEQLIRAGLRNPVKVEVKEKHTNKIKSGQVQMPNRLVNNYRVFDTYEDKLPFLIQFIRKCQGGKFLVFMSTCAQVNFFEKILVRYLNRNNEKLTLLKLHRKLKSKRQKLFEQFRESSNCLLLCTDVMSRGVDIPKVDWVVHFDLPMTMENYVHRCGRSAHQVDTYGNSLLLSLPHEVQFVEMCRQKGVKIQELSDESHYSDPQLREGVLAWVRAEAKRDIHFYELAVEAYVSFIRTYSSKQCMAKCLFPLCDVVDIANAYALLMLPKMPELKQANRSITQLKATKEDEKIAKNFKDILYQKKIKDKNSEEVNSETTKTTKFGFKRNPKLQERLEKKSKKLRGRQKRKFFDNLELEELEEDARVVKKLKKGKISSHQFDEHFGL